MTTTRIIGFVGMFLSIILNTVLIVQIHSRQEQLRKDSAELSQLAVQVEQKTDKLKAETDKLKALAASLANRESAAKDGNECVLIHKPKSGCPAGYVQEKRPRFTERDGSKQFACLSDDPSKEPCTDVLMPGESEDYIFQIPIAPPENPNQPKI
jgi:hypothetical protein